MPKVKEPISLSGLLDSDMDEASEVDLMPTPDSNQENDAFNHRQRGRKVDAKPRKVKPTSQRFSTSKGKGVAKKKILARRVPLKEQQNKQEQSEHDVPVEDDSGDGRGSADVSEDEAGPVRKRGRKTQTASTAHGRDAVPAVGEGMTTDGDDPFEYTPVISRSKSSKAPVQNQKSKPSMAEQQGAIVTSRDKTAEQTKAVPLVDEDVAEVELDRELANTASLQLEERETTKISSHPRQAPSRSHKALRHHAGSASDPERGTADPILRRKLGDVTKKFESLELKYRNLREVGVKEAEANFERLKKSADERNKTANELIAALRKELAAQRGAVSESAVLSTKLATATKTVMEQQLNVSKLTSSLVESQAENKALLAKLAASRVASSNVEPLSGYSRAPASASKSRGQASRTIMVGSVEAAAAAEIAQLKEDIYSDLTGLILRGVDRRDDADVYDCIQTGRNGTLHFHLAITKPSEPTGNHRLTTYEEVEFIYTPRLDTNRDADLLDILPDYLTEEISFQRANAAKFYSRVADCLTKRREE